ncbi:MAG: glucosamine-6-phosphate deaminase [Bacteroidales bacterium]|nr:glucosamine-6-phosphate deaminase [Candidatus Physcousia equi]
MKTNLSSQITLNSVPEKYYRPTDNIERSVLTRFEKIPTEIFKTSDEASRQVAEQIAKIIRKKQADYRSCIIALVGGNTPQELFRHLINMYENEGLSFHNVIIFTVYEYYPIPKDQPNCNLHMLEESFLNHVNVPKSNIYNINGTIPQEYVNEYCQNYEERIAQLGGIDIMVLGVGMSGNIALNVMGSQRNSHTRLVLLDPTSRGEAARTFDGANNVPVCGITMGVSTIRSAQNIFLLAWGEQKANIVQQVVEGDVNDKLSASFLQMHNKAKVYLDLPAANHLTRIQRPWLVTSCEWTSKLIRSAIVWLCSETGKPILKLTDKDYNEHGLGELLAVYGSAYDVNIKIFNDLQHTITGWPGGKPDADDTYRPERANPYPKRVIIFSPHPDDDVISMGGTFQRLVKQGHDVHVMYQTSGNIAVENNEVYRFLHFVSGFNKRFETGNKKSKDLIPELFDAIKDKRMGDLDTDEILAIKALIRRGEARMASIYSGLTYDHIHFLNLPFYETGRIQKNPLGEADVEIVRQKLQEIQPHQIFVAGDLQDPHGTHRICTDAVLAAVDLEREAGAEWVNDCRVWMYRGAWAEWEIENIEMVVPISPEELRTKRNAILKHQSQMESAPFLGNDERLFWQRSEDRNHATAELYKNLGLAAYEAMEAFVEYKA